MVPFTALEAVLGGVIPEKGRRALFVDLVIKVSSGQRTALRLSGSDAGVMTLFPGKPVPSRRTSQGRSTSASCHV